VYATPLTVRVPPQLLKTIDDWIARQKDAPSRPEAIRRLIEKALGKGRA
jgi:metal-responsive CopG/Arc/MetJ family transcriptional regulator